MIDLLRIHRSKFELMVNIYQICIGELLMAWKIDNVPKGILVGKGTGVNGPMVTTGSLVTFFVGDELEEQSPVVIGKLSASISEHLNQLDVRDSDAVFSSRRGHELTSGEGVVRICKIPGVLGFA
jgi:hypothetical protein